MPTTASPRTSLSTAPLPSLITQCRLRSCTLGSGTPSLGPASVPIRRCCSCSGRSEKRMLQAARTKVARGKPYRKVRQANNSSVTLQACANADEAGRQYCTALACRQKSSWALDRWPASAQE